MQAGQPAASVTHSQAKTNSETQAEVQSQKQSASGLSEMADKGSEGLAKQGSGLVQRNKKRKATDAAVTVPPPDPPSPPFPYPILAKRALQATLPAPELHGIKPTVHKHTAAAQSRPPADAAVASIVADSKKASSKGKAKRLTAAGASASQAAAAAVRGDTAHRHSSHEVEAGPGSVALGPAAGSKGTGDKAGGGGNTGSSRPKRCGSCKNCLQKSGKQGCLVLRAAREQAQPPASPAHQEPGPAAEQTKAPKPTAAVAVLKAKATAAAAAKAKPTATAATARPTKAAQAKVRQSPAVQLALAEPGVKAGKGGKANKPKAGREAASHQADGQARSAGKDRPGKRGKACSHPVGSIHSALTQAVELASDMEQPGAVEQQQEAAEALEALKHSPVGPAPPQPAASKVPLITGTTSGHTAAAAATAAPPGASQGEAAAAGPSRVYRGRGRPRKERKPGEELPLASVGPKRGRGRPPKNPPQPAVMAGAPASGSPGALPADGQPRASDASAMPVKVSCPSSCCFCNRNHPASSVVPWGCMWEMCNLPEACANGHCNNCIMTLRCQLVKAETMVIVQ